MCDQVDLCFRTCGGPHYYLNDYALCVIHRSCTVIGPILERSDNIKDLLRNGKIEVAKQRCLWPVQARKPNLVAKCGNIIRIGISAVAWVAPWKTL